MRIEEGIQLDFEDVLLAPKRSELTSRKEVDVKRYFKFKYSPIELNVVPLIASNMDSIGTMEMCISLAEFDCLTALHKFYPNSELGPFLKKYSKNAFYTLGFRQQDRDKFEDYIKEYGSPDLICIDVPNGYIQSFVDYCSSIRAKCPFSVIMAGNICDNIQTSELLINGKVDIIKCGIGGSKVCTTRIITGVGRGQLSALDSVSEMCRGLHGHSCSDGGIKLIGDISKALSVGDFVMIGSLFGGHEENNGEWTYDYQFRGYEDTNPEKRKKSIKISGMSSRKIMEKYYGKQDDYKASEGQEIVVDYKGPIENTIKEILGGIRSAAMYIGAKNVFEMSKCASFYRVSRIK